MLLSMDKVNSHTLEMLRVRTICVLRVFSLSPTRRVVSWHYRRGTVAAALNLYHAAVRRRFSLVWPVDRPRGLPCVAVGKVR